MAHIPGTKPCLLNSQLLISTGVPSIDNVLGGGLPVGSITLIKEDEHGVFAKTLLKYFIVEGVACKQHTLTISLDNDPNDLLQNLPALYKEQPMEKAQQSDFKMKIAFRYQSLPTNEKEAPSIFGHYYDLSGTMPISDIDLKCHCLLGDNDLQSMIYENTCSFKNKVFSNVLIHVDKLTKDSKFTLHGSTSDKNVLRVCIHQLGTIMWGDLKELPKFLYFLRCILRNCSAIAMISIPTHLNANLQNIYNARLINSSDVALRLVSFSGTHYEKNKALADFHGFFYVDKLAAINSLHSAYPGTVDYTFKLLRKKFCVEKLHLPAGIDLDVNDERNKRQQIAGGCGSSGARKTSLDF